MATFRVITLGCKVNQCDGEQISRELEVRGYAATGRGEAEVYVVNTCTVTATADAKARKLIHKLAREHPEAMLIVTGCYGQRDREALATIPGVDAAVGNEGKGEIGEVVRGLQKAREGAGAPTNADRGHGNARPTAEGRRGCGAMPALQGRVRAFLKVQDGCDHRCAYCVVPEVRGRPRSKPLTEVAQEVERLAEAGSQEVVLCGIRLGDYGRDGGEDSLAGLLRELREVGIPRLRLSSLEPMDAGEDLLAEMADHPRLCHHLHLPLQSGDDEVLRQMGRGYTSAQFRELVGRIREVWPDAAMSTDVMVGFPGETDEQFRRTVQFLREIGFCRVHVFPYSARPGTPAAGRGDQVPAREKRQRAGMLLALAGELAQRAAAAWVGKPVSVLFEERDGRGRLTGLTEHYVRLSCEGPDEWVGRIVGAVPESAEQGELLA
jgi:threonylcarbamoyladenosine tRNA methylthiotransferase MtaB